MLLEQCAFQMWSWSIFDSENSFRLLMVQDHKSRPKFPKSEAEGRKFAVFLYVRQHQNNIVNLGILVTPDMQNRVTS